MEKQDARQLLTDILLSGDAGRQIHELHESGMLKDILPEVDAEYDVPQNNPYHIYNVGEHTEHAVDNAPEALCVRLAALLHDTGKVETHCQGDDGVDHFYGHDHASQRIAQEACERLGFSDDTTETVVKLVGAHENRPDPENVDKFLYKHQDLTDDEMMSLMDLQYADVMAQAPDKERQQRRLDMKAALKEALKRPHRVIDLAVDKDDVMAVQTAHNGRTLPLSEREADDALMRLLKIVLKDPADNTRGVLLDALSKELANIRMCTIAHLSEVEQSKQRQAFSLRKRADRGEADPRDLLDYETKDIKWISDQERKNM